jgi:hypothetical protein
MPETTKSTPAEHKRTDALTQAKVSPPTIIVKNFSNIKLISNKYDRLLFRIDETTYNDLKNSFVNAPIKTYEAKDGSTLYSLNVKACDKKEFLQFELHHLYDIRVGFERYNYKGKIGFAGTCVMLKDHGQDKSFEAYLKDKKDLLMKMLLDE